MAQSSTAGTKTVKLMTFSLEEETNPISYNLWDLCNAVSLEPWELDACARMGIGDSIELEADGRIRRLEDEAVEIELPEIEVDLDKDEDEDEEAEK